MRKSYIASIAILTSSLLLGCTESTKNFPEMKFQDTAWLVKKTKTYEGFVGTSLNAYCMWGKFRNFPAGVCINTRGEKTIFSIAEALDQNPSLLDENTQEAAEAQQIEFQEKSSELFSEDQRARYSNQTQ